MLFSAIAAATLAAQDAPKKPMTEADFKASMKELQKLDTVLRNNIEEIARADLERMLLFQATMDARRDAARIEEILADVTDFWDARRDADALALSKQALAEAANVSKALVVIDLQSPSTATLAQERLSQLCAKCHAARRERAPDGTFRIK